MASASVLFLYDVVEWTEPTNAETCMPPQVIPCRSSSMHICYQPDFILKTTCRLLRRLLPRMNLSLGCEHFGTLAAEP